MQWKYVFLTVAVVVVLYLVSFGPGLYFAVRMDKAKVLPPAWNEPLGTVAVVTYYPHILVMAHAEPYFHYVGWWIDLAGEKINTDYPGFRARILGDPATGTPAP